MNLIEHKKKRFYNEINIVYVLVINNIVGYNLYWNSRPNLKRLAILYNDKVNNLKMKQINERFYTPQKIKEYKIKHG